MSTPSSPQSRSLYASPLRVYLCLGLLAITGILCATQLPVSLFPNSSKPRVSASISYAGMTSESFSTAYGRSLESELGAISVDNIRVEKVTSDYGASQVRYNVHFKWGADPTQAIRETQNVINSFRGRVPKEIQDSMRVYSENESGGFFALALYSQTRGLDELYTVLEPLFASHLQKVEDAGEAVLFNPSEKEVRVELSSEKIAQLGLLPRNVERTLQAALQSGSGGSVTTGPNQLQVKLPRGADQIEDVLTLPIGIQGGRRIHVGDIARVDFGPKTSGARAFRTNGSASLILFATPRPGGNIKRMSEELLAITKELAPQFPADVEYKVLVDPSEFIRASVRNVYKEVAIGAGLAVLILFIFIGSLRNVVTAAIEIPLSMVLAFILMKLSGMNLNLISLGGLALSAGMNVDASVVVMENIFRRFADARAKGQAATTFSERLRLIQQAVSEVRFAIIASTIASLVVFLPLTFTSDLTYAILGDLAKTVVFSHGFSAIVALILVPTVRLQLMSRPGWDAEPHSPFERQISFLERGYGNVVRKLLESRALRLGLYAGVPALLAALVFFALPKLPKEIIGRPDTDWIILGVNTRGNTLLKQMESIASQHESELLSTYGDQIQYTFTQIHNPNSSMVMARLKEKKDMKAFKQVMEEKFSNTPVYRYWVASWNPSEFNLPDPPKMKLSIRGGTTPERGEVTRFISGEIESRQIFSRVSSPVGRDRAIVLKPNLEQWANFSAAGFTPMDLAEISRIATVGKRIGEIEIEGRVVEVALRFSEGLIKTPEDLGALPIGFEGKIIPLRALSQITTEEVSPEEYREQGKPVYFVDGNLNEGEPENLKERLAKTQALIDEFRAKNKTSVTVALEDAQIELTEALEELAAAVAISVLLIFVVLTLQFGSIASAALTLVSVPLGFIGVLASLTLFGSTLSLNSVLGVILLNGIAVGNSIILVDFINRRIADGLTPREAAVDAAERRLRPILITSLTTILGMLPIALGFGEGGKILQPLGIAVSGGLWVSMGLTLLFVPVLQVAWLERKGRSRKTATPPQFIKQGTLLKENDLPRTLDGPEFTPGLRFELADKEYKPSFDKDVSSS